MCDQAVPPGSVPLTVRTKDGAWRVLSSSAPDEKDRLPLLLVHGGGYDTAAASWCLAFGDHARRHVVAPDLPGFGGSRGVRIAGPAAATADQLVDVLDALGLDKVVVCGVSMGGEIALQLAVRHPDRVAAVLALAAGGLVPRLGGPVSQWLLWLATRLPDPAMVLLGRCGGYFAGAVVTWMTHDAARVPDEAVQEFVAEGRRPRPGLAYGIYNRASTGPRAMRGGLTEGVRALAMPAVFAHGDSDPAVPLAGSERASEIAPQASFVLFTHCGHWPQLERRDLFNREVRRLLERVEAGPTDGV